MTIIKVTENAVKIVEVGTQGPEGPGVIDPIKSEPLGTQYKISNIRLAADKKIVVTYDDTPGGSCIIGSRPSSGQYKILDIRLAADKKIVITHNDTLEP